MSVVAIFSSAGPLIEWSWVSAERSMIISALLQHLELTFIAVGIGFTISLPLSVAAWKLRLLRPPLVAATGVLYVIPSVALLSLFAPLTGFFSITTAEVALVSYTLLILLRNTVAGLDGVPAEVRDAARGMGYTQVREFVGVDLPLALPSIMAGLRVATVTVIGLVNVTAFIGQGGLGQLIIQGFGEDFNTPIFVGLVLSVLLAALADALLVGAERLALPWLRTRRAVT